MFRHRILIIDDEPDSVYILRFALERAGYEVLSTDSLQQALPIAGHNNIDLVLLDLVLKDGNGLDICRALRENPETANLPIILVTGKLRTEFNTVEGFKAGADDYIMKPFRPAEVVARVETLLERTRRMRDASPVTGLPGPVAIQNRLQRLLASSEPWGVLNVDLVDFKVYNQMFGFEKGDEVLRMLAACIARATEAHPSQFTGHGGGDSFIVISEPAHLEPMALAIIEDFSARIGKCYPEEAARRGSITLYNRRGEQREHPLLAVSASGVTNELRSFHNPLEIAAVGAEIKKALRNLQGSNYLKDRRSERDNQLHKVAVS